MRTIYKIFGVVVALAIFAVGTAVVLAQSQATSAPEAVPVETDAWEPVEQSVREELREAWQTARDEVIETAVADGRLTTEQAERLQGGTPMNRGQMAGRTGPMGQQLGHVMANCGCGLEAPLLNRDDVQAIIADTLGLSVAELEEALADGTRLPHLLAELDVDPQTLREAVREARETAVAAALADGTITQEQADCLLSKTERGPRFHGQRGHGRMGQ